MGRQGKDFGGHSGERRFEGGRGQDFKARGPRSNDGERRNDFRGGSEGGQRDFRDSRPQGRSFGGGNSGGSFERRGSSFAGRDDRAPQRPGNYRRPEGAQGGYGRPAAPRYDDAPRAAPRAAASAPVAAPTAPVVSAQQLKAGIGQANRALAEVIEQFGHTLQGDYDIGAIEVTVSFAQDGRFLGFGAGGAASMKIQLTPLDAESVMEGQNSSDNDDDFVSMDEDEESGEVLVSGKQGAAQAASDDDGDDVDGEVHFDA